MCPGLNDAKVFDQSNKWSNIKFSNNGVDMLISTRQDKIYVVDSMEYKLKHVLSGFENKVGMNIEASFSPDGQFIVSGSQDGKIHAWEVESGQKVTEFAGHPFASACVQFNPRYLMMASACSNLAFWIPALDWGKDEKFKDKKRVD
jgi:COMPASS component SWD2